MLMAGLEAEVAAYVESCEELVDERGYRLVVRNGRAGERTLVAGAGALRVRAPRVNDRRRGTGSARIFCPSMRVGLPRWATCCRSCICVASRRVISPQHLRGSSVRCRAVGVDHRSPARDLVRRI